VPRSLLLVALVLVGCRDPDPPALLHASPSPARDAYFAAAADGDYDALDDVIAALTQEHDGGDAESTAVLGFAHAWKLSERARAEQPPDITEHAALAVASFDGAFEALDDPRLLGFRGSFRQAVGDITDDADLQQDGWFDQEAATRRWPEWGKFTQAYGLITKEPSETLYGTGTRLLWEAVDACLETRVSRATFDFSEHLDEFLADDDPWNRRGCGNTTVAPHNTEGFFTVFGDHFARAGNTAQAERMYEAALAVPSADDWPYRFVALERLDRLIDLPDRFAELPSRGAAARVQDTVVFSGPASCSICHRATQL